MWEVALSTKTVHICLFVNVILCVLITLKLSLPSTRLPSETVQFEEDYYYNNDLPLLVFNKPLRSSLPFYVVPVVSRTNGEHRSTILYNFFIHEDDRKLKNFQVGRKRKIVFHNPPPWIKKLQLEGVIEACAKKACEISYSETDFDGADAVVFDQNNLGKVYPTQRKQHQTWVLFGQHPLNVSAHKLDLRRWTFNWTMTHRLDSDIVLPYSVLVRSDENNTISAEKVPFENKKNVLWIATACSTPSRRETYVKELRKHISVDVVDRCGFTGCSNETSCKDIFHQYKFYLAFEEELCADYITNEYFQTFSSEVIPVVRGGADYSKLLPERTFINTADFKTPQDLAEYLNLLIKNRTAYEEYVSIKSQYRLNNKVSTLESGFCDLCVKLHNLPYFVNRYYDVVKWLTEGMCHTPRDLV